jgi:Uma2 family endonuclease
MATATLPAPQHMLLDDVSWQGYEDLLREFDGRPIRLTYDQGSLEIMTLSHGHESYSWLVGRLIATLTEELNIPLHAGKSTTFRQKVKKMGLEADQCFWIQNEARMRGKKEFRMAVDPPPDLAVEIDITRSSLNRMVIYAAFKVPEVWRFDGKSVRIYRLLKNGDYELCERSIAFPFLAPSDIVRFLHESDTKDETSLVRSFREWIRENVLPAWRTSQETEQTPRKKRKSRKKDENGQGP